MSGSNACGSAGGRGGGGAWLAHCDLPRVQEMLHDQRIEAPFAILLFHTLRKEEQSEDVRLLHLVMNWRPSLTNSRGISRNSLAWSIAAGMCGVECVECGVRACIRQFRFAGVAFGGSWYGEFGLWLCGVGRTLRGKWDWSHLEDSWSSSCPNLGQASHDSGSGQLLSLVLSRLFVKVVCLKWSEKGNGLLRLRSCGGTSGLACQWYSIITVYTIELLRASTAAQASRS